MEEAKGSLGSQLSSYSAEENKHAIVNKCVNLQKQFVCTAVGDEIKSKKYLESIQIKIKMIQVLMQLWSVQTRFFCHNLFFFFEKLSKYVHFFSLKYSFELGVLQFTQVEELSQYFYS